MELADTQGPGVGIFPKNTYGVVWNRCGATALVVGDVVMCDMKDTDGGTTTSLVLGNDGNVTGNVIAPATDGIGGLSGATIVAGYFFGVVVDLMDGAGADNTKVRVQWQGVAKVHMVATAITVGVGLVAANGVVTLTPTVTAGNKVLAIAWEPNGSAEGVYTCWFDGINGFNHPAAS
jgi:hypothetical protein